MSQLWNLGRRLDIFIKLDSKCLIQVKWGLKFERTRAVNFSWEIASNASRRQRLRPRRSGNAFGRNHGEEGSSNGCGDYLLCCLAGDFSVRDCPIWNRATANMRWLLDMLYTVASRFVSTPTTLAARLIMPHPPHTLLHSHTCLYSLPIPSRLLYITTATATADHILTD